MAEAVGIGHPRGGPDLAATLSGRNSVGTELSGVDRLVFSTMVSTSGRH